MWLVVGLGNPGERYTDTRHNIGFTVIDQLAAKWFIALKGRTKYCTHGRGSVEDRKVILMKPLTFMNLSGTAVREMMKDQTDIEELLVIHDDLDLPPGSLKIRRNGSSGGHRGIESIIQSIGSKDFIRLKIGIGRSLRISAEDYVLRPFYKKERPLIDDAVDRAVEAVQEVIIRGVAAAQNRFHRVT